MTPSWPPSASFVEHERTLNSIIARASCQFQHWLNNGLTFRTKGLRNAALGCAAHHYEDMLVAIDALEAHLLLVDIELFQLLQPKIKLGYNQGNNFNFILQLWERHSNGFEEPRTSTPTSTNSPSSRR